jgi:hypothetical protein
VSEYEFLALDRPLDDDEQAEVRSLSTRARITATSFVNEYHWGDFKGDPNRLMERYYDAHRYVANWGTHRVMFRLPCDLLDPDVVEDYYADEQLSAGVTDGFIVLDFTSEDHAGEFDFDYHPGASVRHRPTDRERHSPRARRLRERGVRIRDTHGRTRSRHTGRCR